MNDNGSVEVNSRRVPYYGNDNSTKRNSPTATSNTEGRPAFKKVLDDESNKGQDQDGRQSKVNSEDRHSDEPIAVADRLPQKPKKLASPFDLSNTHAQTRKTAEMPQQPTEQLQGKEVEEMNLADVPETAQMNPSLIAKADVSKNPQANLVGAGNTGQLNILADEQQPQLKEAMLAQRGLSQESPLKGQATLQPNSQAFVGDARNAAGDAKLIAGQQVPSDSKGPVVAAKNDVALNVEGEPGASQVQKAATVKPEPLTQEGLANVAKGEKNFAIEDENAPMKANDPFSFVTKESRNIKEGVGLTNFTRESIDIAAVNQNAIAQVAPALDISGSVAQSNTPQPAVRTNLQELINQMVSQITELTQSGKTETSIVLKHPPMFEGAKLTITAFDTANGEFNIAFENLKAPAQSILDMQAHRSQLLDNLERLGYNVHILSTSTTTENRTTFANADLRERGREQDQGQGQPGDDQQRQRRQRQT